MMRFTAESLRATTFARLGSLGFRPADTLPLPEIDLPVRPPEEVAARLLTLRAVFAWVIFPEDDVPAADVKKHINRNGLYEWLTMEEASILAMPRGKARKTQSGHIGWRLENMWPLAWALGFEPEPDLAAAQIGEEVVRPILFEFLPDFEGTIETALAHASPRTPAEVIAMEYLFYCAHNAVRSAQLGEDTVPKGFEPRAHGGAVHERRHALTWCISPDEDWGEVDLST